MKNFGEILNFCANYFIYFINLSKIFKSLWWVDLCWMFSPNRNLGDTIAVQDLKEIHVWNIFWCSPQTKILAPPLYTVLSIYTVYLCCHLCPPKFLYVADPMEHPRLSDLALLCIEFERLKEIRNEDIIDQFAQNTRLELLCWDLIVIHYIVLLFIVFVCILYLLLLLLTMLNLQNLIKNFFIFISI